MDERNYCVYKHTFPDGWVYVGITKDVRTRWNGGTGYSENQKMFRAIVKYGWDNIKHEILKDGLTKAEAEKLESQLIRKFGESGKCFNKKGLINEVGRHKHWLDRVITEETIMQHSESFRKLNDEWLAPYTSKSGIVGKIEMFRDRIEIEDYRYDKESGNAQRFMQTIYYPYNRMTFRDVYDFLLTEPKAQIRIESEFPVMNLLVNMLYEFK